MKIIPFSPPGCAFPDLGATGASVAGVAGRVASRGSLGEHPASGMLVRNLLGD